MGPYAFTNSGRGAGSSISLRGCGASPPSTTRRTPPSSPSASASISAWNAVDVRFIMVVPDWRICVRIARGSKGSAARCSRPPVKSGASRLRWVRSKLYDVTTSTASRSESSSSPMYQWTRLSTPRCVARTPLGRPLEPEV
ncbi:MAG: hypothetical protein AVDCRST_MAG68-4251 [uncultured Gemmatimonadetes bacterium]|uniref:Uncharacterized protein n=1 Tax=uncultured Gemmatimonadota bacterium TaxID=203437 RepID=A0A6J4MGV2_9BACT|nr:MAG: hypothetical protein AVDCRST_MAG68-4251 [uncultured Gemmatimonadota bacterium]